MLAHMPRHAALPGRWAIAWALALLLAVGGCASMRPSYPPDSPETARARSELVVTALNFVDVDYKWGGNSAEEGFDCSGFTRHVYQTVGGIALPRSAEQQAAAAGFRSVALHELAPGDLVFFDTTSRRFSHVGIYVGDGRFVHAPRTGAQVRMDNMRSSWWASRYAGARRSVLL
jgi:cell wall-associated NlpC family hydrolase